MLQMHQKCSVRMKIWYGKLYSNHCSYKSAMILAMSAIYVLVLLVPLSLSSF